MAGDTQDIINILRREETDQMKSIRTMMEHRDKIENIQQLD